MGLNLDARAMDLAKFREAWASDAPLPELVRQFGFSAYRLRSMAHRLKLPKRKHVRSGRRMFFESIRDRVLAGYAAGLPAHALAQDFKICEDAVYSMARKAGLLRKRKLTAAGVKRTKPGPKRGQPTHHAPGNLYGKPIVAPRVPAVIPPELRYDLPSRMISAREDAVDRHGHVPQPPPTYVAGHGGDGDGIHRHAKGGAA